MLIVEGPDGSGKTTLVNRLSSDLGLKVAPKVVSADMTTNIDLKAWVEDNIEKGFRALIFDRHRLISEPIYGPLFRHRMMPGFDSMNWLKYHQSSLRRINPIVIWCLPPLQRVFDNIKGDLENIIVSDRLVEVYWSYWNAAASWPSTSSAMIWDYTVETPEIDYQILYRFCKNTLQRWLNS